MAVRRRGKDQQKWQIRYDEPRGADGKRKRAETHFHGTKKEAQAEDARLKARAARGVSIGARGKTLFADYAASWIERRRKRVMVESGKDREIAPATYDADESRLVHRILPIFKNVQMRHISPEMIEDAKDTWREAQSLTRGGKPLSQKSVYNIYGLFNKMMADAAVNKYIEDNPCEHVNTPPKGEGKLEAIEIDDAVKLLAYESLEPVHVASVFDMLTGVRRGELLAIHVDDLNMHVGRVWIHRAVTELDGKPILKDLKTKKQGRRFIPLGPYLFDLMRAYLEQHPTTGPLFKDGHDRYTLWHPEAFSSRQRTHFRKLGVHGSTQRLRHTFNSLGGYLNLSEAMRQEILGHRPGSRMTRDQYTTVYDEPKRAAVASIEELLLGKVIAKPHKISGGQDGDK